MREYRALKPRVAWVTYGPTVEERDTRRKLANAKWLGEYRRYWTGKKLAAAQIKLLELYERDGGKCALCGYKVMHPVKHIDWMVKGLEPSPDHIVPKSRGGLNNLENLQLTHGFCNGWRGHSRLTESLKEQIRKDFKKRFRTDGS